VSVTVNVVSGKRGKETAAVTATGVLPEPTCCRHGTDAPAAGAGETVKWQLSTTDRSGLTVPVSVAELLVTFAGAPVTAAGGGLVHANVTDGASAVGALESSVAPAAPTGTPEEPPPPPPPPAL
jgi:hypothetical protein